MVDVRVSEDPPAATSRIQVLHPQLQEQEKTAYIAMVIFLGSWAVMFAGLFFGFSMHRVNAVVWPPPEFAGLPLWIPFVSSLMLVASSVTLQRFANGVRSGNAVEALPQLKWTMVYSGLFIVLQTSLWALLVSDGVIPKTGKFAGHFYLLTTFHALHVLVGLGLLLRLFFLSSAGPSPRLATGARLTTMFWHFVGVAWLAIAMLLFVL